MKTSKLFITISIILLMLLIGFSSAIAITQIVYRGNTEVSSTPDATVEFTNVSDFRFDGNTITSYMGEDTDIVVPASYSLGELKTVTYEIEDGMINGKLVDMYIMPILEDGGTVTLVSESGSKMEIDMEIYGTDPAITSRAVAIEIEEYGFLEGNDIQITAIGEVFSGNKPIESVDLSHTSVKTLSGTFNGCTSLKNIILPTTIEEITNGCFNGCTFESIDLSNTNLKSLDGFQHASIKTITLPNSLNYINGHTFDGSNLEHIDLSNTQITSLSGGTFSMCEELTYVILPSTVTEINRMCFQGCSALETLVIPAQEVIEIDVSEYSNTFYNSSPTIYVPDELVSSYENTYSILTFDAISNLDLAV